MSLLLSQRIAHYHSDLVGALKALAIVADEDDDLAQDEAVIATQRVLRMMVEAIERDNGDIAPTAATMQG